MPSAGSARRLALGRRTLEEVELAQERAELAQRLRAGEVEARAQVAVRDVVEHLVDDVLAHALVAVALEVDDRRAAGELRRVLAVVRLELVAPRR